MLSKHLFRAAISPEWKTRNKTHGRDHITDIKTAFLRLWSFYITIKSNAETPEASPEVQKKKKKGRLIKR